MLRPRLLQQPVNRRASTIAGIRCLNPRISSHNRSDRHQLRLVHRPKIILVALGPNQHRQRPTARDHTRFHIPKTISQMLRYPRNNILNLHFLRRLATSLAVADRPQKAVRVAFIATLDDRGRGESQVVLPIRRIAPPVNLKVTTGTPDRISGNSSRSSSQFNLLETLRTINQLATKPRDRLGKNHTHTITRDLTYARGRLVGYPVLGGSKQGTVWNRLPGSLWESLSARCEKNRVLGSASSVRNVR